MYAPEQGLFKTQLFIKHTGPEYHAFLRAGGTDEVSARIGLRPQLPHPGSVPPASYGHQLFEWVFQAKLRDQWKLLRELSYRNFDELPSMRLQLTLDPDSPLSELCWETMTASPGEPPLSATVAFSRFLYESRPSRPTVWQWPVQILLIVSNPEGLHRFDLESVDQNLERRVLHAAESRLRSRLIVKRLMRPTLKAIRQEEQTGYHITHLLAHATSGDGVPGVILADEGGKAVRVDLSEVADAIASPAEGKGPHLVFLALPLSGDPPHGSILMHLASKLIKGGVQSVAVIQAPLEPSSLTIFMERFYEVLLEAGEVDVAMAEARKRLCREGSGSWDWAWPVLFGRGAESSIQQRLPPSFESKIDKIQWGA
jgi:hypothetical protein